MAPGTPKQKGVRLRENEEVARILLEKHRSMREGGLSDSLSQVLSTAYHNVCVAKEPIRTLKDLLKVKGVGPWVIRQIKGSFPEPSPDSSPTKSTAAGKKGKKTRGPNQYVPELNSAAYAILITLYREMLDEKSYMSRQELIDAAEASGLSRNGIGPDKSKAKPGSFPSSHQDRFSGWTCMSKTLIPKLLVVKSGNPARYMLTEEGKDTARVCLSRSGLDDPAGPSVTANALNVSTTHRNSDNLFMGSSVAETSLRPHMPIGRPKTSVASPELICSNSCTITSQEQLNLTSQEQLSYDSEVPTTSNCSEEIILSDSNSDEPYRGNNPLAVAGYDEYTGRSILPNLKAHSASSLDIGKGPTPNFGASDCSVPISSLPFHGTFETQSSSSRVFAESSMLNKGAIRMDNSILAMPPGLPNENFLEAYEVVLILDDRETFGSRSKRVVDNIHLQFDVPVEIRRLPVGDGIWIARHRKLRTEYILDFIVERKNVSDLLSSIRDSRYKDQKLRLKKCGLRKLIYLVEGDPNPLEASESIKTACFTTEILEGFDVQRTTGYSDTERTYGHLTRSIIDYYSTNFCTGVKASHVCLTYDEFVKKCCDFKKITVSDVFALQLMQVPQVTEETALAVIELYPTILSLARAYSKLGGNIRAQEQMLKNESKMVNAGASRNIFKLVWAEG